MGLSNKDKMALTLSTQVSEQIQMYVVFRTLLKRKVLTLSQPELSDSKASEAVGHTKSRKETFGVLHEESILF